MNQLRKRSTVLVCLLVGGGILIFIVFRRQVAQTNGLGSLLQSLESDGYRPNVGFSGLLVPGTVIQVTQQGGNGKEQPITAPLPFAWASECFPAQKPQSTPFALPNSKGSAEAKLDVDAGSLSKLIPNMGMGGEAAATYALHFDHPRVEAFAKGDISGEFSNECVKKLTRALAGGEKLEWFNVITEAIVADSMKFEVHWKSNTSANSRLNLIESLKKELSHPAAVASDKSEVSQRRDISVAVTKNDENETDIASDGAVILAYKCRPLQKWSEEKKN